MKINFVNRESGSKVFITEDLDILFKGIDSVAVLNEHCVVRHFNLTEVSLDDPNLRQVWYIYIKKIELSGRKIPISDLKGDTLYALHKSPVLMGELVVKRGAFDAFNLDGFQIHEKVFEVKSITCEVIS